LERLTEAWKNLQQSIAITKQPPGKSAMNEVFDEALEEVLILTTGGTIDKVYFDAKSRYEVGSSIVGNLLEQAEVRHPYKIVEVLQKDSLELNDQDRTLIRDTILDHPHRQVLITHGTDTMTQTASAIADCPDRTIVLTGSLAPARFAMTDAMFNIGMALAAVQSKVSGVYIVMNGSVFDANSVHKDRNRNAFIADK
jgi:L-asparaginase